MRNKNCGNTLPQTRAIALPRGPIQGINGGISRSAATVWSLIPSSGITMVMRG